MTRHHEARRRHARLAPCLLLLISGSVGATTASAQHAAAVAPADDPLPAVQLAPVVALPEAQLTTAPSRSTYLAGGAMVGALLGAVIGASFEGSYCDNALYSECSANGVVPGLLLGGAAGLAAGWLIFEARHGGGAARERRRGLDVGVRLRAPG